MSSLDTLLLSYRIYRSFPIYSNVILISYQGVRWISSSVEFFIFIFFLQACRLQTLRLRYPTIFLSYSRSTSRYYNTNECFSQYKWNFIIFTIIRKWNVHTVISNPWSSTTRFQKKRREKENWNSSRPTLRLDPPPQQGLAQRLEMQTAFKACSRRIPPRAFTTFLLTCAGTSATRGTCFVGPAGFFHTPLTPSSPDRAIHDHTLELFPMVNVIIYRSSDRDLSGLPCYIYKKDCDSSECNY